jgi:hypothetical protein
VMFSWGLKHFQKHIGTSMNRTTTFNLASLGYQKHDLSSLEPPLHTG